MNVFYFFTLIVILGTLSLVWLREIIVNTLMAAFKKKKKENKILKM